MKGFSMESAVKEMKSQIFPFHFQYIYFIGNVDMVGNSFSVMHVLSYSEFRYLPFTVP
jgi:hypothetical protein